MTALEVYDLVTTGRGTDFARAIRVCESIGGYCLIGGLAVNCYVEPVYTVDADLVAVPNQIPQEFQHSLNALSPKSDLRLSKMSRRGSFGRGPTLRAV